MAVTTAPPAPPPVNRSARPTRVSGALARREARFVVRHPLVLVGVVASAWVLWSINRDQLPHLGGFSTYVGMGLAPLAGAALLVGHLTASRARRNHTIEIETPTPALQRSRTIGHLVGALVVVPVAAILAVAYMTYLYLLGGTGQPDIGEMLVGPLVVGLGAVVGVTVGTWFPNRFSGLLGIGALAGVQIALQDAEGTRHWFAWWHTVLWHPNPDLWIRPTWGHVAYVAGISIVVAAVAVLRHGVRLMPMLVFAVGLSVAILAGVTQSRPPNDVAVEQVFAQITSPTEHRVTIERGDTTYHVFAAYRRWVDWWDPVIAQTLAPIPAESRPKILVEQRYSSFASQLEEEFGSSTPEGQAIQLRGQELSSESANFETLFESRDSDLVPIRVKTTVYLPQRDPLAIAVAQRVVGLPLLPVRVEGRLFTDEEIGQFAQSGGTIFVEEAGTEVTDELEGEPWWPGKEFGDPQPVAGDRWPLVLACDAEGQAREVVAAWLAAQGSPDLGDLYQRIRADGPKATGVGQYTNIIGDYGFDDETTVRAVNWGALGWMQIGGFGGGNAAGAVHGSPTAVDLAAQLLERSDGEVAALVGANWDTWTDPATSLQVIIDEFDLEAPPTPTEWIERAGLDREEFSVSIAAYPRTPGDLEFSDQPFPICP